MSTTPLVPHPLPLTQEQKLALATTWQQTHLAMLSCLEKIHDALDLPPESPLYESAWSLMDAHTAALQHLLQDPADWLPWYAGHCRYGHRPSNVYFPPSDTPHHIDSLADLLPLLSHPTE
jgi:hypothetical protein